MLRSTESRKTTIAVVGLGGIGGVAAGCLIEEGRHEVTVCTRRPLVALTFERQDRTVTLPLRTLTEPAQAAPVDWVLLCTKVQDTGSAAPWLQALCGPSTTVAVLQNGIDHQRRVAPLAGAATVLPVLVYYNAERLAPDHVRLRLVSHDSMLVSDDEAGRAFARLMDGTPLHVGLTDDFTTFAWRKLLINAIANPMTALTRERLGVLHRPDISALCLAVVEEALVIGRADGAALADDEAARALAAILAYPPEAGTSMYFDVMAGRSLEVEALTGAIVAAGDRHGIDAPLNRALLALLRAVSEAGS